MINDFFTVGVVFKFKKSNEEEYKTYMTNKLTRSRVLASNIKTSEKIFILVDEIENFVNDGNIIFLKHSKDNKHIAFSELSTTEQLNVKRKHALIVNIPVLVAL